MPDESVRGSRVNEDHTGTHCFWNFCKSKMLSKKKKLNYKNYYHLLFLEHSEQLLFSISTLI